MNYFEDFIENKEQKPLEDESVSPEYRVELRPEAQKKPMPWNTQVATPQKGVVKPAVLFGDATNEKPKYTYDATKPYAGMVDQVWGKPTYDQSEADRQNRIIKMQGLTDMLKLVAEGAFGSAGADINARSKNEEIAKAEGKLDALREKYLKDQSQYNVLKMQEMIRNLDYGIRKEEKQDDRDYEDKIYTTRTADNRKYQAGLLDDRIKREDELLDDRIKREDELLEADRRWREQQQGRSERFEREMMLLRNANRGVGTDTPNGLTIADPLGNPIPVTLAQYEGAMQYALDKMENEFTTGMSAKERQALVAQYAYEYIRNNRGATTGTGAGTGNKKENVLLSPANAYTGQTAGAGSPYFEPENFPGSKTTVDSVADDGVADEDLLAEKIKERASEEEELRKREEELNRMPLLYGKYKAERTRKEAEEAWEAYLKDNNLLSYDSYKDTFIERYMCPNAPKGELDNFFMNSDENYNDRLEQGLKKAKERREKKLIYGK